MRICRECAVVVLVPDHLGNEVGRRALLTTANCYCTALPHCAQVIYTLTHNIKLTHTEAVAMATYVDRKVRNYVYTTNQNFRENVKLCLPLSPFLFLFLFVPLSSSKGRAVIKSGSEEDCLRCRELINVNYVPFHSM